MQAFNVLLCHAALCAHLIDEAGHKPNHRVGDVAVFRVLKPTFSIKALCHTASNAANTHDDTMKMRKVKPPCPGGDLILDVRVVC